MTSFLWKAFSFTCLLFSPFFCSAQHTYKKIEVIESGNAFLKKQFRNFTLPDSINSPYFIELKDFALQNGLQHKEKDIDFVLEIMRWVSSRWVHDGNNSGQNLTVLEILKNAKSGTRYRCVEYSRTMSSILRSFGFVSRDVGISSKDASYGDPGSGHAVTEVWLDDLKKWIFVDPQNCVYALYKGSFLNFYEMYELKKAGKYDEIDFTLSKGYTGYLAVGHKSEKEHIASVKNFLSQYFGCLKSQIKINGKILTLVYLMETKNPFFTFQGFPHFGDLIFTSNITDFYFPINENTMIFTFRDAKKYTDIYSSLVENKTIKDYKDQVSYMYQFVPKPDFLIYNDNNMPWFSHYELKLNGTKIDMNSNGYFEVSLKEGMNTISCTAINKNGKKGAENKMTIQYK